MDLVFSIFEVTKDRLQKYLIFCFQNIQSFKGFWKQFRSSYFVTIPKKFPTHELYGLVSQMRRCAVSIPSNIAEGHSRSSKKEQIRFLDIAKGSFYELDTQLEISRQLNYMGAKHYEDISCLLDETSRMLTGLKNSKLRENP